MILRVLTDTNFLDIELKENISVEQLTNALNDMSILLVKSKDGTTVFINPVNIVAMQIINTPPINT